jgi:hypothetical protein
VDDIKYLTNRTGGFDFLLVKIEQKGFKISVNHPFIQPNKAFKSPNTHTSLLPILPQLWVTLDRTHAHWAELERPALSLTQ